MQEGWEHHQFLVRICNMYHVKIECILMEIYWSKLLENHLNYTHIGVVGPITVSEAKEINETRQ